MRISIHLLVACEDVGVLCAEILVEASKEIEAVRNDFKDLRPTLAAPPRKTTEEQTKESS